MEDKLKGNPYLMEFIRKKGGAKKVQHMVDLGYQALVQLEDGRRFGRAETFAKFVDAFPDEFDIIHASTGKPSARQAQGDFTVELGPGGKPWKEIAQEYQKKFEDLSYEHQLVLTRLLKKERPDLFVDQEGVKIESSGQVTDDYRRIGYEQQLTIQGTEGAEKTKRRMITPDIRQGVPFRWAGK